jgi:hypothetical protein
MTIDPKLYDAAAAHWHTENTLGQFLDIKVTASQGGTSAYVKLALFLQHAEAFLHADPSTTLTKPHQATLQQIRQSLDGMGKGITSWAQHDEDYLTLLVMTALSSVPHRLGLFPLLRDWKLLDGEPSAPAWSNGWPYVRPEALKGLGYAEDIRYVTPDWLVETPEHLVFFEFKRPDEAVPNQGDPEKVGRMLVLGDYLAQLGQKRFSLAVMTSEEGQRVKLTPGGTVTLTDAVGREAPPRQGRDRGHGGAAHLDAGAHVAAGAARAD